jgi:hypothetical protein
MPWHFYVLEFVSGLLLANGVPHFVQGVSGHRFQSPFAAPRGGGESPPLINVLWGFANLAAGFALLCVFDPYGFEEPIGWIVVGLGVLVAAVGLSVRFGNVRSKAS